jgi:hypothetical protein
VPTNTVLSLQHIFSPNLINESKFGVNRANYHNYSYGIAPVAISVSSASFSGLTNTALDTEVGTTFSSIDNLTWVKGRHILKFGVNVLRVRLNNSGNTLTTASLSYASADDFVNNRASSATYLQGEGVVGNSAEVRFSVSNGAATSTDSATAPTARRASSVRGWPTANSTLLNSDERNPSFEKVTVYMPIGNSGIW